MVVANHTIRALGLRSLAVAVFAMSAVTVGVSTAHAGPTGAQSELAAITGQGTGKVIISPTHSLQGAFDARVKVEVQQTSPNAAFVVTAGGGDAVIDGVCPGIPANPVATLVTSAGGAGAVEFERSNPSTLSGTKFEVELRLTGSDGTVLQSGCMIITAK
jgi:hypothetical protein